jgi:hypothetical protein
MRTIASAIIVALLAGPAAAQTTMSMPLNNGPKALSDDEKAQKAEQERAYKAAIGKIPDQKPATDPWGNVRAASPTKQPHADSK